uniref:Uncharacterized protein n=1 Tax=Cacopsylla melanoneura TaxID=428564 RepID=A0A8D8WTF7_9HEMI
MGPCNIWVCLVFSLVILCCQANYVSVDDCTEPGAHRYHAHSAHSSAYTSGYTQSHPAPSGYSATSSSSMRVGNAVGSGYGSNVNTGGVYGNEDDLQMASSVYSPQVSSGYGSHRGSSAKYNAIEESATYGSRTSGSGYGSATRTGYGASGSGYGARESGYGAQDSQVREKFEDLKQKADTFVHTKDSPPPVPVTSHIGSSSSLTSSQYSQHAASGQRYGSSGNILGVTYGTTGTEEDDSQRLVPVQATLPAASALTAGSHKESTNSAISYSTSGVAPSTDEGVNFSISQNVPLGGVTQTSSQSKQFEELKRRAEAFVHEGAPPPSSSGIVTTDAQSSTNVQTLPVQATSHGTYVVPVRVTVTREHTVLPGDTQEYYNAPSGSATKHISEYSSSSSRTNSGASVQPGYVSGNAVGTGPIGSSSSYSYNSQGVSQGVTPPRVYTVGPQGSVLVPNEESSSSSSSTSYGTGSGYTKQSNVHRENVVVAGAVPIVDTEAAERRSNKLFDLVSGYGTFLPAKEEEEGPSPTNSRLLLTGNTGSGSTYEGSVPSYGGSNSGYSSQSSSSRLTTSGSSGGVYQPVPLSTGYSGVIPASGTIPAGGSVRKTTTGYTYFSNQAPSQISPGVPVGDPLSPPEISGSYFNAGGAGGKHSSYSKYESQSTSGGYGLRNEGVSGGYGVRNEGLSGTYGSGGVANENVGGLLSSGGYTGGVRDQVAYNSQYATSRDASSAGYGVKDVGYASRGGYTGRDSGYASRDANVAALDANCGQLVCDSSNLIAGSGGNVKKYGISSSWSSKSQTVNGKTTQSKEAVVTVNDNGKVDTYATHS